MIKAARSFKRENFPWVEISPAIQAQIRYPHKNPPLGPMNTARPASPPAKTGNPSAPKNRNSPTLAAAADAPIVNPANITKKSAKTIGSGLKGIGKLIYPPIIINAVKREIKMILRRLSG